MKGRGRQRLAALGEGEQQEGPTTPVSDGSYNYNHLVRTRGIWHTRLLFHSTDDSSLLSETAAKKKEVVLPWGACSSSW